MVGASLRRRTFQRYDLKFVKYQGLMAAVALLCLQVPAVGPLSHGNGDRGRGASEVPRLRTLW